MSGSMIRIYYIPDYFTSTYCKEDKKAYQQYLKEYATILGEDVDKIVEEAGVDLYDAIKELKENGIVYSESKKLYGMIDLLSLFEVCNFPCCGEHHDDSFINLNSKVEKTIDKLRSLIVLDENEKVIRSKNKWMR